MITISGIAYVGTGKNCLLAVNVYNTLSS